MSSLQIFKVNHLIDKNKIDTIYVFYGAHLETDIDLTELFEKEPTNKLFDNIFTPEELVKIQEEEIDVEFLNECIHIDDTIGVIKLKICLALGIRDTIDELYLYSLKKEKLSPQTVYQVLTQNDTIPLTYDRLKLLLVNIRDKYGRSIDFFPDEKKEVYTFEDIVALRLDDTNTDYYITKVLGQKFFMVTNEYPYIIDPFYLEQVDPILEKSNKEVTTLNSHLLFDNGQVTNNNIYLCTATNVLEYLDTENISEEYGIKVYYPFLYRRDINSLDELELNKRQLISENKALLNEQMIRSFKNVDMFYDIYKFREPSDRFSLIKKKTGIKNFRLTLYPETDIKIPVDIIFKLLHATHKNPLIKFNPSTRQENMYRLYTDDTSIDGRKIPYLNKAMIFKLVKGIGKTKSVATMIRLTKVDTLICEFHDDASIVIYSITDFESPILLGDTDVDKFNILDGIIRTAVNPIIEEVGLFFEQSGYKLNKFDSVRSELVEIDEIVYQTVYKIATPIEITKFTGCLTSIFNIESSNFKKGLELRYKRVSNFNKKDSQEAFVIEKQKQGYTALEIIDLLVESYDDMTKEKATELLQKIISELQVERGVKHKAIEIKVNPGFKTTFSFVPISGELTIQMHSIDNIFYLDTVPLILNSLIRITQDKGSTAFSTEYINQLCSANEIEDIKFNDIIAESEVAANELVEYPEETAQELEEYNKQNRMDELLDIFGYTEGIEGEGEDYDYEYEGGQPSSSSSLKVDSDFSLGSLMDTKKQTKTQTQNSSESLISLASSVKESNTNLGSSSSIDSSPSIDSNTEEKDIFSERLISSKIPLSNKSSSGLISLASSIEAEDDTEGKKSDTEPLESQTKTTSSSDKSSSGLISLASSSKAESTSLKSKTEATPLSNKSSSSLISLASSSIEEGKAEDNTEPLENNIEATPLSNKSSSSLISLASSSDTEGKKGETEGNKSNTKPLESQTEATPLSNKSSSSLISLASSSIAEGDIEGNKSNTEGNKSDTEDKLKKSKSSKSSKITPEMIAESLTKERTPIEVVDFDFEFESDDDNEEKRDTTPTKTEIIELRTPTPSTAPLLEEEEEEIIPVKPTNTAPSTAPLLEEEEEEGPLLEAEIIPVKPTNTALSTAPSTLLVEEEEEASEADEEEYIDVAPKISAANQKKIEELKNQLSKTVHDIAGTQLNNPYFFQDRMEKRDPGLFVTMKEGSMMAYSRMCPSNVKRQPVILTEEEKNELIQEHPDLYSNPKKVESDFVEYRHNPENPDEKYYYTCPRYWCLLTDKMVTKQQIMDGECGGVKYDENTYKNAIIPKNAKKVPKGQYVYQFYDEGVEHFPGFHKENTQDGNCIPCCYTKWNTAAVKERRDKCQAQSRELTRKTQILEEEEGDLSEAKEEEEIIVPLAKEAKPVNLKAVITGKEQYIKGPEVYPLGNKRWGFMPVAIERLLHESSASAQVSQTNTNIKLNHPCLLRHGVENSMNQSFIACIASALFYAESIKDDNGNVVPRILKYDPEAKDDVPSIAKMKEFIINSMTIDSFITYQNGDLITTFAPDETVEITMDYVADKYSESKLYNKLRKYKETPTSSPVSSSSSQILITSNQSSDLENNVIIGGSTSSTNSTVSLDIDQDSNNEEKFVIQVVKSFENFKKFLNPNNTTAVIDHTYLWDIITRPNPKLFNSGINLVIFEITDNDITNNVELLCPTNHYSNQVYVARRKTLILIKRENTFEPIYSYLDTGKKLKIVKMFSEYDPTLAETSKSMRAVLNTIIKPLLSNQCAALPSMPKNVYKFQSPPTLSALIKQLEKRRYTIETQVVNFQGKVIGVIAESRSGRKGYIPCYPSSLCVPKYPNKGKECKFDYIYMDEVKWQPYKETIAFLKEYYKYEEPQNLDEYVKCIEGTDLCKVIEDNHIVGILTNTNQFVQISEVLPENEVNDNIRSINNSNFLLADEKTLVNKDEDSKRIEYIRRIKLETNFYNVFRNTIRILLGDYVNNDKRIKLQQECNKRYALYNDKLEKVIELLEDLVGDNIVFSNNFNVQSVKDIFTCLNITDDKCSTGNSVCFMTNNKCTLVLPNINLITKQPTNKTYYYGKMADELIRYNRIKSYIFKSKTFLSFNKIGYNLRDDEIIILQSLLTQEFFEGLVSSNKSKFAKYNSYDTTNPIKSQPYVNEYSMDAIINPHELNECERSTIGKIESVYWRKCFPTGYKEKTYYGLNDCTFNIVIDIIANVKGEKVEIDKLRSILNDEYYRLTKGFTNKQSIQKIADILSEEGKKIFADQLVQQILSFTEMVYTYSYFITNFDLWILLSYFKIPSIFISNVNIPETRYNEKQFVVYTEDTSNDYVFIVTPGLREKNVPEYGIIITDRDQMLVNYDVFKPDSDCTNKLNDAIRAYVSIDEYLNVYKRDNKYRYIKKRKDERKKPIALLEEVSVLERETPKEEAKPVFEEEFEEIIPVKKPKPRARARKVLEKFEIEGEEDEKPIVQEKKELAVTKPFVKESPIEEELEEIVPVRRRRLTKKKVEIRPQETKKFTRKAPILLEEVDEL